MEKCISKEILFDFNNNELSAEDQNVVSQHISECKQCANLLLEIKESKSLIKVSLDSITPELSGIPTFQIIPDSTIKINEFKIRRLLSLAASVSLILAISTFVSIKIFYNLKPVVDYEYLEYIPDINEAWQNNSIIVTKYDSKGNPVKHQVIENSN